MSKPESESSDDEYDTVLLPDDDEYLMIEETENGIRYKLQKRIKKCYINIDEMRNQDMLCDVTLVADHTEVRAHKLILAATSLFFYTMFSGVLGKSKNRIVLEGVHRLALPPIISYIYTGEILINEDNVEILLKAANKLGVIGVFNACCDFLEANLNTENCFHTASLAKENNYLELMDTIDTFMRENFGYIASTEEYLELPQEKLSDIIKSDDVKVSSEIEIFEAVMRWIKHNIQIRRQYLPSLMKYVRFPLMASKDLIEKVEQEPLFEANAQCVKYVREAMRYQLMEDEKKSAFSSPRTKPRVLPDATEDSVPMKTFLVFAGSNENNFLTIEKYDLEEQQWLHGPDPFYKKIDGSCILNTEDKVYVVGGFDPDLFRKVDVFDLRLQKWLLYNDYLEDRILPGAAILDGDLYVLGGFQWTYDNTSNDSQITLKSCEKLDHQTGEWERIASMVQKRRFPAVCAMDGMIYAVGGSDGEYFLSCVECYSPVTNSWRLIPDMSNHIVTPGVVGFEGKLFVLGGGNGKCVEAYDPVVQRWTRLANMRRKRNNCPGAIALNGLLYVAGGMEKYKALAEVYDPRINTWTMLPHQMIEGIQHVSGAVVDWPA